MKRVWMLSCVIALLAGCGGDSPPPTVGGGGPKDRDRDATIDEDPSDASVDQRGPMLKFMSPQPATGPTDEAVITETTVMVRCQATQRSGGSRVDYSSIQISMDKAPGSPDRIQSAVVDLPDSVYEARFDVGAMRNGELNFHCQAKDLATTPATAMVSMTTLLDLGPKIEVFEPMNKKPYPLTKPVAIRFQVDPAPLTDGDSNAVVKDVKLQVAGTAVPIAESSDTPGLYQTSVNFDDASLFPVPPSNAEVLITATNDRSPNPATRTVKLDIGVDGAGPAIKVDAPGNLSMQHGEVSLVVTITDSTGVDAGTVRAVLKGVLPTGDLVIERWNQTGSKYQQTFDTRRFRPTINEVTINISASDTVGNSRTIDHHIRLDNLPPVVSLDPPNIREYRKDQSNYYCSEEFDPVGDLATNDLETVQEDSLYRVLVEDRTNQVPGELFSYYAGVDTSKVELFAQPDPAIPLLIDTNDDDQCDQINFDDLELAERPTVISLTALTPRGGSWFSKNDLNLSFSLGTCTEPPNGVASPPAALCAATEMFRVVPGRLETKPPAVYAKDPTNGGQGPCEGDTWQLLPIVGEGWACLAARAVDTIGNVGISEPLRVCFDDGTDPPSPCAAGQPQAGSPPSCRKDCTIGDSQRFSSGVWKQQ